MSFSRFGVASLAMFGLVPSAFAGFRPAEENNVAVYWGQNSLGTSSSQERLSYYCENDDIDIIYLAFMTGITTPAINFASALNDCTAISGTSLYSCPEIEADIQTCQDTYNKTIMLSLGGSTYSEGGWSTTSAAQSAATKVWELFGPDTTYSTRPFGDAIVDGFDFDFESTVTNALAFATELRALMDANTSKDFYLSAAPQCPYPDAADEGMLDGGVSFDLLNIQFYNNAACECSTWEAGVSTQPSFNLDTWVDWAKSTSANTEIRLLIGAPASSTAASNGYVTPTTLASMIDWAQPKFPAHFGGVMFWDASQLFANTVMLTDAYTALNN